MEQSSLLNHSSLIVSKLNYELAGKRRIKELSLAIECGKKIALLGLNGAGKSTLIRLLLGELAASSGIVEYTDGQHTIKPHDLAFKQCLGYQADTMLAIAELNCVSYLRLCGSFKQIEWQQLEKQIKHIANQWQIEGILNKPMTSLSKGNLQKLSIAQVFLGEPQWLFFDEPCQSLDPVEQVRFNQNISALEKFQNCFISTHNVDHALEVADQILLIHQGKLAHHFVLDEPTNMLLVVNKTSTKPTEEFEQSLSQLNLIIENRFSGVYSLQPIDEQARLALQNFSEQWSNQIEFLLPEKDALMPLFRLLASGELDLAESASAMSRGGEE